MMETPEKAAPMTPVTGGIPATGRGADALFQPPSVDEVGEEQGWKEGWKVGPISVMQRKSGRELTKSSRALQIYFSFWMEIWFRRPYKFN